ncbi:hypothetical protein HanIR_Chr08g0376681 [Helianthus annuus]|nr:hypothetical protein HanIR_Chr08g0376681 [Helianthus annuus]
MGRIYPITLRKMVVVAVDQPMVLCHRGILLFRCSKHGWWFWSGGWWLDRCCSCSTTTTAPTPSPPCRDYMFNHGSWWLWSGGWWFNWCCSCSTTTTSPPPAPLAGIICSTMVPGGCGAAVGGFTGVARAPPPRPPPPPAPLAGIICSTMVPGGCGAAVGGLNWCCSCSTTTTSPTPSPPCRDYMRVMVGRTGWYYVTYGYHKTHHN